MSQPQQPAWREGATRLRAAATTEPGRLRIIGAALAAVLAVFGGVTAWQVSDRSAAADAVVAHSQPLSADAASIYRSLADADTTAASGFLTGGQEPKTTRDRYDQDIALASELLVKAAANTSGSDTERRQIATLNKQLPVYTGLVDTARANNRQGLPLGGAYLRYASERMRGELLPAASALYEAETGRLGSDYRDAKAWPWAALAAGIVTLGALGWAQRRNYLRTNRVFNHGLLAATAATAVVLLWLVSGHTVARAELDNSDRHGAQSLQVLNEARISSLQARGDENLTLVSRGSVLDPATGDDLYEASFQKDMKKLFGNGDNSGGTGGTAPAPGSLLDRAGALADGAAGRDPVAKAVTDVGQWLRQHSAARTADVSGDYKGALQMVNGGKDSTGESFDRVDSELQQALSHEQAQFRHAADNGRGALTGLTAGAAVLALLAATGAVLGIGRRLSEYR
ncbi:hypothetical protein AB0A70_04420 [Streptomyces morookaense]|uniref:hypothetical protein n=1 Tax=Streptomyces morookaense TaxID=1970 RepID=UPI0033F95F6C